MHHAARERLQVASELGAAIDQAELELHYQPIVELDTGRIIGAEALVRWAHPERGLLLPADFIPVAEDSGHIIELGHWVRAGRHRPAAALDRRLSRRAIPAARQSLAGRGRWPGVARIHSGRRCEQHGVDPDRLALEISETGLMTGDVAGLEALLTLKKLGVGIEIDDFGTGYSSISYLRRLPIDTVKVDQSLIRDIATDRQQVDLRGGHPAADRIGGSAHASSKGSRRSTRWTSCGGWAACMGRVITSVDAVPAETMTRLLAAQRHRVTG